MSREYQEEIQEWFVGPSAPSVVDIPTHSYAHGFVGHLHSMNVAVTMVLCRLAVGGWWWRIGGEWSGALDEEKS